MWVPRPRFLSVELTNTRHGNSEDALDDMVWAMVSKVRTWHAEA